MLDGPPHALPHAHWKSFALSLSKGRAVRQAPPRTASLGLPVCPSRSDTINPWERSASRSASVTRNASVGRRWTRWWTRAHRSPRSRRRCCVHWAVEPLTRQSFQFGQGEVRLMDVGQTWVRIEGREVVTLVLFNDQREPCPCLARWRSRECSWASTRCGQEAHAGRRADGLTANRPGASSSKGGRRMSTAMSYRLTRHLKDWTHAHEESAASGSCRCSGSTAWRRWT